MLRITEDEKRHIKSLYYDKLIGEQSTYYSPNSPLQQTPNKQDLLDTYNNIITRYDVTTSEGRHKLLDDTQLVGAVLSFGTVDNYIGILHSFYWFYEGISVSSNDEEKTKKFILGVIELLLAIPGIAETGLVSKWKESVQNVPLVQTIKGIDNFLKPFWTKIDANFKSASNTLTKINEFLEDQNLGLLANLCKKIIQSLDEISEWVLKMSESIRTAGGDLVKGMESGLNLHFTNQKTDNVKSTLNYALDDPNRISTQKPIDMRPGNTKFNTQDSTDPTHYMPKTDPTKDKTIKIKPN